MSCQYVFSVSGIGFYPSCNYVSGNVSSQVVVRARQVIENALVASECNEAHTKRALAGAAALAPGEGVWPGGELGVDRGLSIFTARGHSPVHPGSSSRASGPFAASVGTVHQRPPAARRETIVADHVSVHGRRPKSADRAPELRVLQGRSSRPRSFALSLVVRSSKLAARARPTA